MNLGVCVLDPLADLRWDGLLERSPGASVFHSRGWLEALKRTYGYEPIVLTTTGHGPLENGLVLCRVRTWLSRRLVSLPFTDHCEPLVDRPDALAAMLEYLRGRDGAAALSFVRTSASKRSLAGGAPGDDSGSPKARATASTRWI